jgi:hypothetical protein
MLPAALEEAKAPHRLSHCLVGRPRRCSYFCLFCGFLFLRDLGSLATSTHYTSCRVQRVLPNRGGPPNARSLHVFHLSWGMSHLSDATCRSQTARFSNLTQASQPHLRGETRHGDCRTVNLTNMAPTSPSLCLSTTLQVCRGQPLTIFGARERTASISF